MRLDRLLSNAHAGTRSQVKKLVKDGRVRVNGVIAVKSGMQVDEDHDEILLDDTPVVYEKYCYIMLNKPAGYISATEGRVPTVMDLIHEDFRGMFPCGRLDKDTEGLLLITNDGPLAHRLLSPKCHVEKEYYVEHTHAFTAEEIQKIETGITYEEKDYQPAGYREITDTSCYLTLNEGKYHEIKLMIRSLDDRVTYLKRIRMKNLRLDERLRPGEYRFLTEDEISDLKAD